MSLRELVSASGKTQEEIATELGVHQTLVSLWVCGKCRPTVTILSKLARCLGCTTDDIIKCFSK